MKNEKSVLFGDTGKWPDTDKQWCVYYKQMDEKYSKNQSPRYKNIVGPLDHDYKCPIHGVEKKFNNK